MRSMQRALAAALMAGAGVAHLADAASYTWTQYGTGTFNWSDTGNWTGGIAPPVGGAADASVTIFPDMARLVLNGTRQVGNNDLGSGGTFTVNQVTFNGWTHNGSSGQSPNTFGGSDAILQGATLNFAGAGAKLSFVPTYNWINNLYYDVNANVSLGVDTTFFHYDAATVPPVMRVNGVISGPGRLTVDNTEQNGSFGFALTGNNTFTGGLTVGPSSTREQLYITSDANLGAVPGAPVADSIRLKGSLTAADNVTVNANRGIALQANGAGGLRGTGGWLTYGGKITGNYYMSGSGLIRLTGTDSDFGGVTYGSGVMAGKLVAMYTADATIELAKFADEGVNSSAGKSGAVFIDGGGGGTIRYIGSGDTSNRSVGSDKSLRLESSGTGALTLTGAIERAAGVWLYLGGTNTGTQSGQINGTGSLIKDGVGAWTISGTNASTGTTGMQNGTLTLNYTVQNNNKIASAGALTLGAANAGTTTTLNVQGNNGVATTQNVASTTLAVYAGNTINVTAGTGAGANTVLNLGAITRGTGSTLSINYAMPGAGTAAVQTSSGNNAAGILGGWAVVNGSDWATVSAGTVAALSAYTGALPTTGGGVNDNRTLAGSQSQTGAVTIDTLKLSDTGAGQSLDLVGNSLTLGASGAGGLLYAGGTSNSYEIKNTGAIAYVGAGASEFLANVKSGSALTISARLIGNGVAGSLVKFGDGTLIPTNTANNYTGVTEVQGGTLKLGGVNSIPDGTGLYVNTGAVFDLAGNSQRVGHIAGFGTITNSGAADATITSWNNGDASFYGVIQDGATNKTNVKIYTATQQYLYGASTYTGTTELNVGWLYTDNLGNGGLASGVGKSSSAAGSLLFTGGALGYVGNVAGSTDRLFTLGTGGGTLSTQPYGTPTFTWSNPGPIAFSGSGTRTLTLQATGYNSRTGAGALGVFKPLVADGPGGATSVTIQGSAGYGYTGMWRLDAANGYTGITTANNYGILRASDGVGLPANSPLVLNGGVFETPDATVIRTLGSAAGQVRLIQGGGGAGSGFSAFGGTGLTVAIGGIATPTALQWGNVDFNPTALILNEAGADTNLTFTNAVDLNSATARTLKNNSALGGASTMSGALTNTGGNGGITKDGDGLLILTGANTFTGKTTVTKGMLGFNSIGNVASAAATALGKPANSADGTIDLGSGGNTAALQYLGPTASTDRVINLAGTTGGVMIESSGSGPLTFTAPSFTATGNGAKTLYLTGNTGGAIQSTIPNSTGATSVSKAGTGVWELNGLQSYTGLTTIGAGVLRGRDTNLASTGVFIRADNPNNLNSVWESDLDITRGLDATPVANKVRLYASNWYNVPGYGGAGFSAKGGNVNVALGGVATPQSIVWASTGGWLGWAQKLVLNETTATGTLNFMNPLSFNGQGGGNGYINIASNGTGGAATAVTLSGVLSNGGFAKSGPGTLIIGNSGNTFAGGLIVYDGTVQYGATGVVPAANNITVYGGTLDLNSTSHTITGGGGLTLGASPYNGTASVNTGSGSLTAAAITYTTSFTKNDTTTVNGGTATINGNLVLAGASGANDVITVADSTATATELNIPALVSGSGVNLYKDGAGTLVLSAANSYSGATILRGGILSTSLMANGGTASGIGSSSNASGNLNFNYQATFQYTGPTVSTDRLFGFTYGNGGNLDASGTGPITFANTGVIGLGGGGGVSYVLGLTGSNTGNNTLYPVLSGANPSILKTGIGTWVLASTQTYTGGTTVSAGTLVLGMATNTLADTGAVLVNGGTLDLGSNSDTVGAVTLASGAITGTGTLTGSSYAVQSGTASANLAGGAGGLTKSTSGAATLSGTNTYTGTTAVSGGILAITGTHTGGGNYTVSGGATLAGTGTITPATAATLNVTGTAGNWATVSPGMSIGTLTYGKAGGSNTTTLGDYSNLAIEVDIGGTSDVLNVIGTLNLTSLLDSVTFTGTAPRDGAWYTIATATGGVTGTLSNWSWNGPINVLGWQYSANSVQVFIVPEPMAAGLLLAGSLFLLRRRR